MNRWDIWILSSEKVFALNGSGINNILNEEQKLVYPLELRHKFYKKKIKNRYNVRNSWIMRGGITYTKSIKIYNIVWSNT